MVCSLGQEKHVQTACFSSPWSSVGGPVLSVNSCHGPDEMLAGSVTCGVFVS